MERPKEARPASRPPPEPRRGPDPRREDEARRPAEPRREPDARRGQEPRRPDEPRRERDPRGPQREPGPSGGDAGPRPDPRNGVRPRDGEAPREGEAARGGTDADRIDWRKPDRRRGGGRRGGRRRRRGRQNAMGPDGNPTQPHPNDARAEERMDGDTQVATHEEEFEAIPRETFDDAPRAATDLEAPPRPRGEHRRQHEPRQGGHEQRQQRHGGHAAEAERLPQEGSGMLVVEMGGFGTLRQIEAQYLPSKADIFVPMRLIQMHKLRDGAIVTGRLQRGQKHKYALIDVLTVDGKNPNEVKNLAAFKTLTTIDPDFHYAVGDATGNVSMRIVDILCPVGRGQRGLIVAPPRTGKTTILRQFAEGITKGYPDVDLLVLLVDERPEEATEWKRSTKGQVFVSTADEMPKTHVQLAESVWKRATRLVELGHDVVLLLDSITRLARAYNNLAGGSGRTMSGGLDSRAMERPRQIFGSARNTETAGSLTILGTTLIDTGSRMDQLIFEEFKGTGNMELVLSRKLADRRIFPAIDIEKSGTRKEEKIIGLKKLKNIHILRRVIQKMNFVEAMELLVTKLEDVETNDEFLKRFEIDPEA
jgi:transcription termination factor Rho